MRLPRLAFPFIPTERTVWIIAALAPIAVVIAAVAPGAWFAAPVIAVVLIALAIWDAVMAGELASWEIGVPDDVEVGVATPLDLSASLPAGRQVDLAVAFDPRLGNFGQAKARLHSDAGSGHYDGIITLTPERRGTARLDRAWLRWQGPLGLGARQVDRALGREIRVWPDLSPVRSRELQTHLRDAQLGLINRRIRGEGTQFEALSEFEPGMDRRRIDWKASARHTKLYARENETERNNQILFAFDCGQSMCEPVDGMPRIDRAVSAALACSYVALKGGDRVALFGFAQRPGILTPFVTESRSFHRLQAAAAGLDYHAEEANFTFAMATLATRLKRRSLIILFSDFTDPTAAQLMVESIGRIARRHLVMFVTIADQELEEFAAAHPGDLATLARSVTADTLMRQRALVLQQLRQMGVEVIEAPWQDIGFRLIDRYFEIKRSGSIG